MEKTPAQLRDETIATFKERLEADRALLEEIRAGKLTDCFIVRQDRGNVCIKYPEDGAGKSEQPRSVTPASATRFQGLKRAEFFAARTKNGANETPKVVLLSIALEDDMSGLEILIARLSSIL